MTARRCYRNARPVIALAACLVWLLAGMRPFEAVRAVTDPALPAAAMPSQQPALVLSPDRGPCPVANQQQITVRGSGFTPGVLTRFVLRRDRDGAITAANTSAGGPPAQDDGTFVRTIPLVGCGPDEPAGSTFTITLFEYRPDSPDGTTPCASATFTVTTP